jgi:tRNA nucleotidyltransferase (CCA-adding enzyme)
MLEPSPHDLRVAILDRLNAGRHVRLLVHDLARFEERSLGTLSSQAELPNSEVFRHLDGLAPAVVAFARARWPDRRLQERIAHYLSELAGTSPALTGSDIEALGVPHGPAVGRILSALLDARLDGRVTTPDGEREIVMEMSRELDAPE